MAFNHRGSYSHALTEAAEGGPAITTNEQDRLSYLQALADGARAGLLHAGGSLTLQVDLKQPQVWIGQELQTACCAPMHRGVGQLCCLQGARESIISCTSA